MRPSTGTRGLIAVVLAVALALVAAGGARAQNNNNAPPANNNNAPPANNNNSIFNNNNVNLNLNNNNTPPANNNNTPPANNNNTVSNSNTPATTPPPILNSYGVPVPGATDAQVKTAVDQCINDFLAKQSPPPGFTFDRYGRLIGGNDKTKVTAVVGVGIDGFKDVYDFWLHNGCMASAISILEGKGDPNGGGPTSTGGPLPAMAPENVPNLNGNTTR